MLSDEKKTVQGKPKAKVTDRVKDYGNDPFFVKKAKESKKFLEEHGFPNQTLGKK